MKTVGYYDKILYDVKDFPLNEVMSEEKINSAIDPIVSQVVSLDHDVINVRAKDADDAMQYIDELEGFKVDPAKEKKLLRKIDCVVMPMIILLMASQFMDKTTSSYAAIMGLRTDLHMSALAYEWVGSCFHLGYLAFVYPANLILQKYKLSRTLSVAVIAWSIVLMCHAACKTSAGFLTCRVLLGVFESFMNSAYILLVAIWYRKEEQATRSIIWWSFQGLGTILGAGIAYGLADDRSGYHSFASWRLLYIITGVITTVLAISSLFLIPDSPSNAWFLNEEDRKICLARSKSNQQGYGNHVFKPAQFKEAMGDVVTWLIFIYGFAYGLPDGQFNNFGTILLHGDFGFSTKQSLLMSMPGGALDIIYPLLVCWINDTFLNHHRMPLCNVSNVLVVIGMCLLNFTHHKGSRLTGYFLFYLETPVTGAICSMISSNVAGYTKKGVVNAAFLIAFCVGNAAGPFTFIDSQKPNYSGAKTAMLVCFIVVLLDVLALNLIYKRRNSVKDKKRAALGDDYKVPDNIAFADITDMMNPEFRYSI